jgi:hypothetical protein
MSLRDLAFDAVAGLNEECENQLPITLRTEYWCRRWIQLAKQYRCSVDQFADAMLQLLLEHPIAHTSKQSHE